jgi:Xaa-Pro aminopeptidase
MGDRTTDLVAQTARFLQDCQVREDEVVLNDMGNPLTIGELKSNISLWAAERDLELPEGFIFAIGRDAGIPHSSGNPTDVVSLGKTIIYDIYPQERGGGYFYDFTRTWCLGYAPEAEQKIFQDVKSVYETILVELEMDRPAPIFQERTCELFENLGYETIRQNSQLQSGFVHSLGHGLGLDLHERPWFRKIAETEDQLEAGSVVTIEPGLYFPEQGMGCRIEDSVWVRPDGKMEILADYPYDLVLPMTHWKS